jgi:peptidoglycan L-alanyl-D-glutamate endopeptidase CwlK
VASTQDHLATLTADTREAVVALLDYAASQGIPARVIDSARTCEEQMDMYAQGRTLPGDKVTWAPGCRSWHTHGRAVDLYLGTWELEPYLVLGPYWQSLGGRWGGDFGDYGHFEWRPGLTMVDMGCPHKEGTCAAPGLRLSSATVTGIGMAALGMAFAGWTVGRALWSR